MPFEVGSKNKDGVNYEYTFTVHGSNGCYQLTIKDWNDRQSFTSFETDVFTFCQTTWKLRLARTNASGDGDLQIRLISYNNYEVAVWFKATLLNLQRLQHDFSIGNTYELKSGGKGELTMGLNMISDENQGYALFDRITLCFEICVKRANGNLIPQTIACHDRDVRIEMITNEQIQLHVDGKIRFGLAHSVRRCTYTLPEHTKLMDVDGMIADEFDKTICLWICRQMLDGSLEMPHGLMTLPYEQLTLADIVETTNSETTQWLKLYVEEQRELCTNITLSSRLLFIKWMDCDLHEMTFAGTIVVDESDDWDTVMDSIENLLHATIGRDMVGEIDVSSIFKEYDQIHVQEIEDPYVSIEQAGVKSGSVLIVTSCPQDDGHLFDVALTEMFMNSLDVSEESDTDSSEELVAGPSARRETVVKRPSRDKRDEVRECVVCLSKPQTSGFVHKNTSHICVCEDCTKVFKKPNSRCPVCMEPIEHIVLKYF